MENHPQGKKQEILENKIYKDLFDLSGNLEIISSKLNEIQCINDKTVITAKLQESYINQLPNTSINDKQL